MTEKTYRLPPLVRVTRDGEDTFVIALGPILGAVVILLGAIAAWRMWAG